MTPLIEPLSDFFPTCEQCGGLSVSHKMDCSSPIRESLEIVVMYRTLRVLLDPHNPVISDDPSVLEEFGEVPYCEECYNPASECSVMLSVQPLFDILAAGRYS